MDKEINIFQPALFNTKLKNSSVVKCNLCPRYCEILDKNRGFCGVRYNCSGILYSLVYGYPAALQVDPIEKKPFAEFLSGTKTFSIGTYGCNLNCSFCQNYHLSRGNGDVSISKFKFISAEAIVEAAIKNDCRSVAFTYNEPTVWVEYGIDIAKKAKENHLAVVLVSNGFISKSAAEVFYPLIDAANIDMKGFSESFYAEMINGKLEPVLESVKLLYDLEKHVELTNLIIPGKNDSDRMVENYLAWVESNLDLNVPLHFSAYRPMYKCKSIPGTSPELLYSIRACAEERGFKSVYLGNIY
jgi:pyruvate formate lyase activating enzyme